MLLSQPLLINQSSVYQPSSHAGLTITAIICKTIQIDTKQHVVLHVPVSSDRIPIECHTIYIPHFVFQQLLLQAGLYTWTPSSLYKSPVHLTNNLSLYVHVCHTHFSPNSYTHVSNTLSAMMESNQFRHHFHVQQLQWLYHLSVAAGRTTFKFHYSDNLLIAWKSGPTTLLKIANIM